MNHAAASSRNASAGAAPVAALREERPLPLPAERCKAVRQFTPADMATAGTADDDALQDFPAHGYTPAERPRIGADTMSRPANRMVNAPMDHQVTEFAPAPM
ncbi:hypothetical protein LRD69_07810 [Streptomyces sp. JH14]|uniref:hypothetical protein n=1 Tax=Streptomyces sp. JH14 TaxID=2793630 RepID=UPI0023F772CC|nr:hypothetical protein [Streptomyces sp. JH14]MDF6042072.1 hypothetical protein [Streptomyces sp. JH14]